MPERTLWLIGMMGSGKSTVGELVAAELGVPFFDVDEEIARREGVPVTELVRRDEPGFRSLERHAIAEISGRRVVAATGGGAVLDERNVAAMHGSGLVVWLEAPSAVLAERVGDGEGRPLLEDAPVGELERILAERLRLYRAAAHVTVDATAAPRAVAASVVAAWGEAGEG